MQRNKTPNLYIIVPCYNEEALIASTAEVLTKKLSELVSSMKAGRESRIVFVDDGSTDETGRFMHEIHERNPVVSCIYFTRNYGHQAAVLAGYMFARDHCCDAVISIDADLQQDVNAIDRFLDAYMRGADIVFGVRNSRNTDGVFKRATAGMFYSLMTALGCKTIRNHADFRLLSANALDGLSQYTETNLFLRGIITDMGFPSEIIFFDVRDRQIGRSKYSLGKMLRLAMDGITSFSIRPIHFLYGCGLFSLLIASLNIIYTVVVWVRGDVVPGWATIVISIWFLGGMQLIGLGIIGEYIGRTYMESKNRPRYLIREIEHERL